MKHPENLHRDYIPVRVSTHEKSKKLQGIVVCLEFYKVQNTTWWQEILTYIGIYKCKEIYFWLPYKTVVETSNKYGVIGPKSRDPYANQWFQIKETHIIYEQGLDNYRNLNKTGIRYKNIPTNIPFEAKELFILTRKEVIRMLDNFVFNTNNSHKKRAKNQNK